MMRRIVLVAFAFLLTLGFANPALAQQKVCTSNPCSAADVGVFMQGITPQCGNTGDCSLNDILQVFNNVGNFILGIVGSLVLLMFIVGGMMMLVAGARPELYERGKKTMINATVGIIIVFVAYAGIFTLQTVLTSGQVAQEEAGSEELCDPSGSDAGKSCGLNMVCTELGSCESKCTIDHFDDAQDYECIDKDDARVFGTCETNKCPGAANIQCCPVR